MKGDTVGVGAIIVIGVIGTFIVAVLYGAWVLSLLWAWFAVPIFNVSELSLVQAIGLRVLSNTLLGGKIDLGKKEEEPFVELFKVIVTPTVFLAVGWIVQLFM